MTKNGLFALSVGCLFILLSYMMEKPIYLILSGIVLIIGALVYGRKPKKSGVQK